MKAKNSLMGMLCLINKLLKIKHILALILVVMCVGVQDSIAQTKKTKTIDELGELKVGDTVPEELWNHPMELWTAADGSTKTITLNDYRGKVIILDFWATWCGGCINYFPHMQDIQYQGGEGLVTFAVTYETSEIVQTFSENNTSRIFADVKDSFHSIIGQALRNFFPRQTIPHIIVINKAGRIEAITAPQYLNHEAIAQVLKGSKDAYIPLKRNGFVEPRLALNPYYDDVKVHGPTYYRSVIGFTDGVSHDAYTWKVDSINKAIRFNVPNTFIVNMYHTTRQFGRLSIMHNRIILNVEIPKHYIFRVEDYIYADWKRQHWYTYEASLPLSVNQLSAGQIMKEDLDLFLELDTRIEIRSMPCLLLKKIEGYTIPDSLLRSKKTEFKFIADVINQKYYQLPYVIDETGGGEAVFPIHIAMHEWKDLEKIRPKLWAYGFDLVSAERELDMFVLSEKGRKSVTIDQLELKEYGYIPKIDRVN